MLDLGCGAKYTKYCVKNQATFPLAKGGGLLALVADEASVDLKQRCLLAFR